MARPQQEPLDTYLKSFINYERYKYFPKKVDLSDFISFLNKAGDPQEHLSPSLLIAGTNGKGSTAAMLASILRAAGYRTGTFSSPHLFSYRERIAIDGKHISKTEFKRCIRELTPVLNEPYQRLRRTFFEVLTTVAFIHFRNQKTDINILEVGLGGKKDSTNVVIPVISVITRIGFDHTATLGRTLSSIAREKCGIIKKGIPVVTSKQHPHALRVIQTISLSRKAKLLRADTGVAAAALRFDENGIAFRYREQDMHLPMRGQYQWDNLCTALLAAEVLDEQGFPISAGQLEQGISRAGLRGRFDIVGRKPLTILDGAHNPSALRALMHAVHRLFGERKLIVVFSCLTAKDRRSMAKIIKRYAERVILTRISSERAATLAELKSSFGMKTPAYPALEDALLYAQREAGRNGLILVTGSIYLVAEAYSALAMRLRRSKEQRAQGKQQRMKQPHT